MRYRDVPTVLRDGPFTTAAAVAAGLSRRQLQGAEWRHLFREVWVHAALPDSRELRLAAVRLVLPAYAVVCGLTAAWLWGADVRREDDLDVHVSFPARKRRRARPGMVVSQETLARTDIWDMNGVAVTSPLRTTFDCLRLLRGVERLVVADAMTHLRRTTIEELRNYCDGQHRLRNLRVARLLLDDVEPASESPMETRLRVGLVGSGLPRPAAQWEVRSPLGAFVARLDLAYPDQKVAVEYDGAWHWQQRRADDRRRDAVRALGWTVIVVSADDLREMDSLCGRVRRALAGRPEALTAT